MLKSKEVFTLTDQNMSDTIFELRKWEIVCKEAYCYAQGFCYYNPRFLSGRYIHTSPIQSAERYEDGWLLHTKNSLYAVLDETLPEGRPDIYSRRFHKAEVAGTLEGRFQVAQKGEKLLDLLKREEESTEDSEKASDTFKALQD